MPNKIDGLLGLARRAGKISLGHDATEESLKSGKAYLCLLASDASERLLEEMKRTVQMFSENTVVLQTEYSKFELSQSVGAKPVAVLTVNDEGFAKAIEKQIGRD